MSYAESTKQRLADGSWSRGEERRREQADLDARPMTTRCAFCPTWSFVGTVGDGRESAARHRARMHPETLKRKTRRKRGPSPRLGSDAERHAASAARQADAPEHAHGTRNRYMVGCRCAECVGGVARVSELCSYPVAHFEVLVGDEWVDVRSAPIDFEADTVKIRDCPLRHDQDDEEASA